MSKEEMRFTVIDTTGGHDTVYAGLADIKGNHGNLMLTSPESGQKHWYNLDVHEATFLRGGWLKVVRVK